MELREGRGLLTGAEGGDEAEEEADGQDENAEGDGAVSPVDEEEGQGEEESEECLGFVGVDREAVVGGVEHLGERDEVEQKCGYGGRDGDMAPAGTVVEGRREDGQRGDAIEENGDSEPEEGHEIEFVRFIAANLQYIGSGR